MSVRKLIDALAAAQKAIKNGLLLPSVSAIVVIGAAIHEGIVRRCGIAVLALFFFLINALVGVELIKAQKYLSRSSQ
jgi:hypothetical protein